MNDYEENKLSWWFLILAAVVLILMLPLSFLIRELVVPLITIFLLLIIASVASRVRWRGFR